MLSAFAASRTAIPGGEAGWMTARIYVSAQTHYSAAKAARLAGFPPRNIVSVPVLPATLQIDVAALEAQIEADLDAKLVPHMVVGTAGTTNTGAFDDLVALRVLADKHGLWLHVDGAWGAPFAATARCRERTAGIGAADSLNVDFHKALHLPYAAGALFVRSGAALVEAHSGNAEYMPDRDDFRDAAQLSPDLSRPDRAMAIYVAMRTLGRQAFVDSLNTQLDITQHVVAGLRKLPHVRIEVEDAELLTAACFRVVPPHLEAEKDLEELDELQERITVRVVAEQRVFVATTRIPLATGMRRVQRFCVASHRTSLLDVEAYLDALSRAITTELK